MKWKVWINILFMRDGVMWSVFYRVELKYLKFGVCGVLSSVIFS